MFRDSVLEMFRDRFRDRFPFFLRGVFHGIATQKLNITKKYGNIQVGKYPSLFNLILWRNILLFSILPMFKSLNCLNCVCVLHI